MLTAEIWLRMSMVKGLAVARSCTIAKHLIAYADIHFDVLTAVGLDESQSQQFIHASTHYIAATLAWLEHPDHHMLIYGYPTYPQRLSHISSAPLLLLITGDVSVVSQLQIAMVGISSAISIAIFFMPGLIRICCLRYLVMPLL